MNDDNMTAAGSAPAVVLAAEYVHATVTADGIRVIGGVDPAPGSAPPRPIPHAIPVQVVQAVAYVDFSDGDDSDDDSDDESDDEVVVGGGAGGGGGDDRRIYDRDLMRCEGRCGRLFEAYLLCRDCEYCDRCCRCHVRGRGRGRR